ncbi:hypothetical protein [Flagellimonas sp.]|uniref:hypothetical protein n=1 Tax=Flagellimonas sp. TaxID=2058762 RepID=UPI003B5CA07E
MKNTVSILFAVALFLSCNSEKKESSIDLTNDKLVIDQTIKDWDKAWETKNLELALKHYADQTDWTNAFGDRVQSKEELKDLLGFIFNMDFVMAGENNYGENEITFINDSTVTVRSQNIRKNQEWADGTKMDDRYINHLRIYQKRNDVWLITNHMISQAWPKDPK